MGRSVARDLATRPRKRLALTVDSDGVGDAVLAAGVTATAAAAAAGVTGETAETVENEAGVTVRATTAAPTWQQKSIAEFNLLPVPGNWLEGEMPNSVWKSYYNKRTAIIKAEAERANMDDDDDGEGAYHLWKLGRRKLRAVEKDIRRRSGATLGFPSWSKNTNFAVQYLDSEDGESVETADYVAHVWSPFAIPRALKLKHRFHHRARNYSVEFYASWDFAIVKFNGDENNQDEQMVKLCSNCYEDEVLCADVIDVANLKTRTVSELRRCLFGKMSRDLLDDFSLLKLIFASMATPSFNTLDGDIGYFWSTFSRDRDDVAIEKRMKAEGINWMDYYPGIRWLEYHARRATGALRPVDAYYESPTIRDAMGYNSEEENESDSDQSETFSD
jgi:hypothetical protein